jgi:RNase P subunit RPR2
MGFETKKQSANGMYCCPNCDSILVQPVNWHQQGDGYWNVQLRCPECEWWGRDSYSQTEADRYDEELDRGSQQLIEDLRALIRANMTEEADRFAAALASDSILPEDFQAGRGLARRGNGGE